MDERWVLRAPTELGPSLLVRTVRLHGRYHIGALLTERTACGHAFATTDIVPLGVARTIRVRELCQQCRDWLDQDRQAQLSSRSNQEPMMKITVTKEWCLRMARLEGDATIGAGLAARDPTFEDLPAKPRDQPNEPNKPTTEPAAD